MQETQQIKPLVISPYVYISELYQEQIEDDLLQAIKDVCLVYISTGVNEEFDELQVEINLMFLKQKITQLKYIKKTLHLESGSSPLTAIGHAMDMITVQSDLKGFTPRSVFYELSTHVDLTLEIMTMCYGVLERIKLEGDYT